MPWKVSKVFSWKATNPGRYSSRIYLWVEKICKRNQKPLYRQWTRSGNTSTKVLQCDLESIKNCSRISEADKLNRDILLFWLWQEGKYTNLQIGDLFGLTHSSVSRRVTIIRKKMATEQNFQRLVETFKSQIKPWPHCSDPIVLLIRCCLHGIKVKPETMFRKPNVALVTNRAG